MLDEYFKENQSTHFIFSNLLFFKIVPFMR